MFHKHEFQVKTNILWCKCGKIKHLPCNHKWKIHSQKTIIFWNKKQTQEVLVCEICGEFKSINTTTGEYD